MFKYASLLLITIVFIFNILLSPSVYSRDNTVVANVFGVEIKKAEVIASKSKNIYFMLMPEVLAEYKKKYNITVTDEDINNYFLGRKKIRENFLRTTQKELKEISSFIKEVSKNSKEWKEAMSRKDFLEFLIKNSNNTKKENRKSAKLYLEKWKIDVRLYKKYGGRLAIKSMFIEPIDAYYKMLKEYEKKRNIEIFDKNIAEIFWRYFENSSNHIFVEDEEKLLQPEWLIGS